MHTWTVIPVAIVAAFLLAGCSGPGGADDPAPLTGLQAWQAWASQEEILVVFGAEGGNLSGHQLPWNLSDDGPLDGTSTAWAVGLVEDTWVHGNERITAASPPATSPLRDVQVDSDGAWTTVAASNRVKAFRGANDDGIMVRWALMDLDYGLDGPHWYLEMERGDDSLEAAVNARTGDLARVEQG